MVWTNKNLDISIPDTQRPPGRNANEDRHVRTRTGGSG